MRMNAFSIKDLENLSGIKAHTIRIWEQRYSFLKPQRSQTNIRYYHSDELKTLLNVALLNKQGYKISHINTLLHGMIDLDTTIFEGIIDDYIFNYGIDNTIRHLIFPFLNKIGILWMT